MNRPTSSNSTSFDIAERIRETVRQAQLAQESTPRNSAHEAVTQAIRMLARQRVSSTLRQLRSITGLSYEDVAAQTGLTKQMLFDIEYKERRLSRAELQQLALCYGVDEDDILGIDLA